MTYSTVPSPTHPAGVTPAPTLDTVFGKVWPEHDLPGRPRLLSAALVVGLAGALVIPERNPGLGTFLVLMSVCGVVAAADGRLRTAYHLGAGVLCTLLVATVMVRDAQWVVALCMLAAFAVGASALADGRSMPGIIASSWAVPLASLRGLPWLGRSVTSSRVTRASAPAVRTAGVTALLLVVFGLLFASADALFAAWLDAAVPSWSIGDTVGRAFLVVAVGGLTLTGVYVALNPPRVERLSLPEGRPVRRTFEWLVPVAVVVALFAVFVAAQLTVMFGGHDYLRRTTGLTYATYVHQGFVQLTVATALTIVVVAVTARKAPRSSRFERLLLRSMLGALCSLTLVVVASALHRVDVYEDAYGFTRLRLLVSVFEGWLGVVVVLVMVAGVGLRGRWLPRAALVTGAVALLALAVSNPDASIAGHNLARYLDTGKVDAAYLHGLSGDATPVLARNGFSVRCAANNDDWLGWNLGRARAQDACSHH
jgi:hypothetical protein